MNTRIAMNGRSMHVGGESTVAIDPGIDMEVAHVPMTRATLQCARFRARAVVLADADGGGGGHD